MEFLKKLFQNNMLDGFGLENQPTPVPASQPEPAPTFEQPNTFSQLPLMLQNIGDVKGVENEADIESIMDNFETNTGASLMPRIPVNETRQLSSEPKVEELQKQFPSIAQTAQETKTTQTSSPKKKEEDAWDRQERMMMIGAIADALSGVATGAIARASATPLTAQQPSAFKNLAAMGGVGVDKTKEKQRQEMQKMLAANRVNQPTFAEKERIKAETKDEFQETKEKRRIQEDAKDALSGLDSQEQFIDKALKLLEEGANTGPVDQYISKFTDKGQKIQKAINNISLDKMVKMFAGMSKAIDSDAERAFFQSTQPSMSDYESVNIDTLNDLKKNIQSLREKTKKVALTGETEIPKDTTNLPEYTERNGKAYRLNKTTGTYQLWDGR